MEHARFTLALPNEPELLDRLITAVAVQDDPPIIVGRSATAVLAFEEDVPLAVEFRRGGPVISWRSRA
jgi:hypothetical protein